jgi:hypothetical protein
MTEPPGANADTLNILVVDDSAMMRTLIKRAAALSALPIGRIFEAAGALSERFYLALDNVPIRLQLHWERADGR